MKSERLLRLMGDVEDQYITESEPHGAAKKRHWMKIAAAAAACMAIVAIAGAVALPSLFADNPAAGTREQVYGSLVRVYKDVAIQGKEVAWAYPWDLLTDGERYSTLSYEGIEYSSRGRTAGSALLGGQIGTADVMGTDPITGEEHEETMPVYEIPGADPSFLIAAGEGDEKWIYFAQREAPDTLGALMDLCDLSRLLDLRVLDLSADGVEETAMRIEEDNPIWDILAGCRDAVAVDYDAGFNRDGRTVSFQATSDPLGIYKRVLSVSEEGYLDTNIFDYGYQYEIGEEAAKAILEYVEENAEEIAPEPYLWSVGGTVTEIGEDYLIIDDSVLCADPDDGIQFRIDTSPVTVSRVMQMGQIQVGSIVSVDFTDEIDTSAGYLIDSAVDIQPAEIIDGGLAVPE